MRYMQPNLTGATPGLEPAEVWQALTCTLYATAQRSRYAGQTAQIRQARPTYPPAGLSDEALAMLLRERLQRPKVELTEISELNSSVFWDNNGIMLETTWPAIF